MKRALIARKIFKLKWLPARLWFDVRNLMRLKVSVRDPETDKRYFSRAQSFEALQRMKELFAKEPDTISWIRRQLGPDDIFLDIGANVGTFSIFAATRLSGAGHVYAMEPHLANAIQLLQNVASNKLSDRISVLSIAASNTDCLIPFHYKRWGEGASGSQLGVGASSAVQNPVGVELKVSYRIDTLIAAGYLRPPNLIKIDTDGIEMEILAGMEKLLRGPNRPRSVLVEVQRGGLKTQVAYMDSLAYALKAKCFSGTNALLLKEGCPEDKLEFNAIYEPKI